MTLALGVLNDPRHAGAVNHTNCASGMGSWGGAHYKKLQAVPHQYTTPRKGVRGLGNGIVGRKRMLAVARRTRCWQAVAAVTSGRGTFGNETHCSCHMNASATISARRCACRRSRPAP